MVFTELRRYHSAIEQRCVDFCAEVVATEEKLTREIAYVRMDRLPFPRRTREENTPQLCGGTQKRVEHFVDRGETNELLKAYRQLDALDSAAPYT